MRQGRLAAVQARSAKHRRVAPGRELRDPQAEGLTVREQYRTRRYRRGSYACVHVTLNEVTGYGVSCANERLAGAGAEVLEDAAPARRRAPCPNEGASPAQDKGLC